MKFLSTISLLTAVFLGLGACSTNSVERVDAGEEIALTDRWNAKDSELVANEMIDDMLSFPWVAKHNTRYTQRPTISVQRIANESHEMIPVDTFINDLKRAVTRSGMADFAANAAEREAIRKERAANEVHRAEGTGAASGQEVGTNYALTGTINSIVDAAGRTRVTFYQVDMKLVDMETNLEVWNGQKKIQKVQKKKKLGLF